VIGVEFFVVTEGDIIDGFGELDVMGAAVGQIVDAELGQTVFAGGDDEVVLEGVNGRYGYIFFMGQYRLPILFTRLGDGHGDYLEVCRVLVGANVEFIAVMGHLVFHIVLAWIK
jgi:hypothetical protein